MERGKVPGKREKMVGFKLVVFDLCKISLFRLHFIHWSEESGKADSHQKPKG